MVEITVLGSGSSGNATLIRSADTAILVDAGFSCKQLVERMADGAKFDAGRLDGILVSHEHIDHIRGLRVLTKRLGAPVYSAAATHATREVQEQEIKRPERITSGESFSIGAMTISPFTIPHDAADPLGFIIEVEGLRIGHVTDIGYPTELARHLLRGCHVIVLETNHDRDMLLNGPYPWHLKQRIMSRTGHMSNPDAGELLAEVVHSDLVAVVLAHLSRENNTPDKARGALEFALGNGAAQFMPKLMVASQFEPCATIRF